MSLHYEWTLSLRPRPDAPDDFLDELRFYLGLTDQPPRSPTLGLGHAELAAGDEDVLAGGPIVRLVSQQEPGIGPPGRGLFVRTFVLDDAMYDLIQVVPSWLARWSLTEGWIGFAREELNLNIWLSFYAAQGHAYAAKPGEEPQPLAERAPPFVARQTTESWTKNPNTTGMRPA